MPGGFEKSVKGATKLKLAAPKSKYIENILVATHTGEAGVAEVFRTLQIRLRDSAWTIVFKALIVLHLMIREGQLDAALGYLSDNPKKIAPSNFSEAQSQGHNIRRYAEYLITRAKAFEACKTDHVRSGPGRLKRIGVDKGLLRETEIVQKQIRALLRCDLLTDEPENEISLTAFRLLTLDLLTLYSVMNEGTINVLEHYFEMSRPDSIRALAIYKTFTKQTEEVVQFLGVARHFQSATRLEIPKLKHASTDLARLLEDDLNDPDFDLRRREYLAKKGVRVPPSMETSATADVSKQMPNTPMSNPPASNPTKQAEQPKPPPVDLIDFFDSIEQNQQPMGQPTTMQYQQTGFQQQPQQPFYPQQTGFQQQPQAIQQQPQAIQQQPLATGYGQPTQYAAPYQAQGPNNPFGQPQQQQPPPPQPLQAMPTGAGFGGYSPQPQSYSFQSQLAPIPQEGIAAFPQQQQQAPQPLQPQHTNPFRQSTMLNTPTGAQPPAAPLSRQNTNPFARRLSAANTQYNPSNEPFQPAQPPQVPLPQPPQAQPIQPQRTGTNPFARASPAPQQGLQPPAAAPLRPNPTGSTNPFRQSQFINQQTGQGWQNSGQSGTMGGLEQLETMPVFPRPGMT
ncbi:Epsin-like, N-terminal [Penicillium expansum]|uniref:Epsin-like, N-terminal n=1 Tax=Penicillium expansum TaxID=27334 RepID=A0A0A2J487_PENEN|nr:Epsin-like, N-terminal [Penicillium expansum]KGO41317.1 Epsin-like, N-terminal [Penicillium expansum]KGO50144.1 Epsin-like, N-terminal [Penicillium expansum]